MSIIIRIVIVTVCAYAGLAVAGISRNESSGKISEWHSYQVELVTRMNPKSLRMLTASMTYGGIEDVGLGFSWDAATLDEQVHRRAAMLSQMGMGGDR